MTFGPLQSETARTILDKLDSAKRPGKTTNHVESVVYIRQSTLYSESTAVLWILRDLGGAWRVFILLRIAPRFLRDAIYRWIAKNRYRWMGKQDKCMVPTPELRSRFIE